MTQTGLPQTALTQTGLIQTGPRLILASQSRARAALLTSAGLVFSAQPARVDEAAVKQAMALEGAKAEDAAFALAGMKAARIRDGGALVIGADQILVCDDIWFDKPATPAEAREHLCFLRGRLHELVTAMVCFRDGVEIWRHLERPRLQMRHFSDAFLDLYLEAEGEAALGSVGAYRLEGLGVHLFERSMGEHSAILGLPLLPLLAFLRGHGVVTG